MNSSSVTAQVNMIKSRPNLLLWYTGDEPDGTSDPLNATTTAYDLIYSLDGYHPVSLVLNCQDYEFTAYTGGTDIVLQDTYMIGNNVTFSSEWHTPCTPDFGDCGCDNCRGEFEDISDRMDEFAQRLFVLGWETMKAVWTVPQAFGNDTCVIKLCFAERVSFIGGLVLDTGCGIRLVTSGLCKALLVSITVDWVGLCSFPQSLLR